jgi:Flp pilus assembly protein TadB
MEAVSSTTCPHGLPRASCEICRVLEPASLDARPRRPARRGSGLPGNLATVVILAVVGVVVVGWVAAAFFAILHIVELLAVALGAGWVGFKLGVHQGRRSRR